MLAGARVAGTSADQRVVVRSPALRSSADCVHAPRWPCTIAFTALGLRFPVGETGWH